MRILLDTNIPKPDSFKVQIPDDVLMVSKANLKLEGNLLNAYKQGQQSILSQCMEIDLNKAVEDYFGIDCEFFETYLKQKLEVKE